MSATESYQDEEVEDGARARILVVDDDPLTATLWSHVLEKRGFEAVFAMHPEAALELAASFRPDVAVLDIGLPTMDGHELGEKLRALLGDVRLIAVTGDGRPSARERSSAFGFAA